MTFHEIDETTRQAKYRYLWHSSHKDYQGAGRKKPGRPTKSKAIIKAAFDEVFAKTPSTVTRANVSPERKRQMKVAIALSKARKAGARIPKA